MSLFPPYSVHVVPSAPTDLVFTPKEYSTSVSLSWKPPKEHHNGKLIDYTIVTKRDGVLQASKQSANTVEIIDGLNSDTEYEFQVSARNAAGNGPAATVLGCTGKKGSGFLFY